MTTRTTFRLLLVAASVLAWVSPVANAADPASGTGKDVPVLRLNTSYWGNYNREATPWRVYETWSTDVARMKTGALVRVSGFNPRDGVTVKEHQLVAGKYTLRPAKRLLGSTPPPGDWRMPDFNDANWLRRRHPMVTNYRALAHIAARGKFVVTDPAKVGDMTFTVDYRGGVAVAVNGREIARRHLSAGALSTDTLAEDYPDDATLSRDGKPIEVNYRVLGKETYEAMLAKRRRTLTCTVPASTLRKGVNVVTVSVHRSPAPEAMFTVIQSKGGVYGLESNRRRRFWWNRCALEAATLRADPDASGVAPNVARPPLVPKDPRGPEGKGVQVWTVPVYRWVDPHVYANPGEAAAPMRLVGARNGAYSGQVVVGSDAPLGKIEVTATFLGGPVETVIPADAVEVRYPRHRPARRHIGYYDALALSPDPAAKVQPVWVTVNVPKTALAGDYRGLVTVVARGERFVVPLQLKVVDWTLVEAQAFTTFAGLVQSPESVAMQFGVPMWSDAHLRLLDETFRLMAQLGTKTLYLPVKCRSHFGNPHTMIRWVKQPDGSHGLDFSIVEKYLDVAVKRLGKVPVVCAVIYDGGPSHSKPDAPGTFVTELDPATGALSEMKAPDWGTPESPAFWKPVFDGLRRVLAKRGLEKSMMVGLAQGVKYECVSDLKSAVPDAGWVAHSHLYAETFGNKRTNRHQPVTYLAQVGGLVPVFWDPEDGRTFYGWRNPRIQVVYPRDSYISYNGPNLTMTCPLAVSRLGPEGSLLTGRQQRWQRRWKVRMDSLAVRGKTDFAGVRGFGRLGADFWPLMKTKRGAYPICGRYPGTDWGTLDLSHVTPYLLAPGERGAISTVRFEMLREGLQEAEARIFVQNALLDEAPRAKLGKARADRLEAVMNARTRAFRYYAEYYDPVAGRWLLGPVWEAMGSELYAAAAEVDATLRK